MIKTIATRIGAVFAYNAMTIIGGAAILGDIPVWKAAVLSGISAASQVVAKLAQSYADDGQITKDELNEAFGSYRSQVEGE
jgi:hypothetical protein